MVHIAKRLAKLGNRNPQWKGDKVSYSPLHQWVKRQKGKAKICIKCESSRFVQWANRDGEYSRNLDDWIELCSKCHYKYDDLGSKIYITRRKRYGGSGVSKETKQKISETKKIRYAQGLYKSRFGENNSMFGKTHSEEYKQKLRERMKGKNNPNWKGGKR